MSRCSKSAEHFDSVILHEGIYVNKIIEQVCLDLHIWMLFFAILFIMVKQIYDVKCLVK